MPKTMYCSDCGAPVTKHIDVCPRCGASFDDDDDETKDPNVLHSIGII